MIPRPGPQARPPGEAPGGTLPHYEGVEVPLPDLATSAERARGRRGKNCQWIGPQWCEPPCVLPYDHYAPCWDGSLKRSVENGTLHPDPCPDCGMRVLQCTCVTPSEKGHE